MSALMRDFMREAPMQDATSLAAQVGDNTAGDEPTYDEQAGDVAQPSPLDPVLSRPVLSSPVLSSGGYALDLIQRQVRRLGKLQGEVLADRARARCWPTAPPSPCTSCE